MQKKQYGSVFAFIFGTYFAVCVIVLGVAGIGYANDYNTLKRHVLSLSELQAQQIMSQLEGEIERLGVTLSILSSNPALKEVMADSDEELAKNTSGILHLKRELNAVTQMDTRLHMLVYFFDSNSLLDTSQRRYSAKLLPLFCREYGLSEEEFMERMDFSGDTSNYAFEDGRVWLMKSVYDTYYKKKAVLMIEIDMNSFIDIKSGDNLFVLAADDVVIYEGGVSGERSLPNIDVSPGQEEGFVKKHGYYFVSYRMNRTGWQCCMGIAERSLSEGLRRFRLILVLELIGAALLVIFLSLYSARKMYRPIRQMLQLLDAGQDVKFRDTYGMLAAKLEELITDNRKSLKRAKNSQIFIDNYQICRILNGEIKSESAVCGLEKLTGIQRQDLWVMVLLQIPVKNGEHLQTEISYEPGEELKLQFFVLQNIVSELILDKCKAGAIYWQEKNYCLFVGLGEGDFPELKEKLAYMADFYENLLHTALYVEIGQPKAGFEGTKEQYEKLLDELKYHIFWQGDSSRSQVWMQPETDSGWSALSFGDYMDASRKLYNFLLAGEYRKAYETLDYIFQNTFSKDPKYLKYNVYRMYGLAAMMMLAIEEQANETDREFFEKLSFEERLGGVDNVEEFMRISKELFDQMIEYDSGKGQDAPAWLQEVVQFLKENYRNPNLSVSDVADEFWISVPHLSRTFKRYMDCSVLEYIQLLRVKEAKRLMAEGMHVAKASEQVGYLDAKALTRAFKRHEGITPGKYRELALQRK